MHRFFLLALVSPLFVAGCDRPIVQAPRPKAAEPLPPPVGEVPSVANEKAPPSEPAYHSDECEAILALKKLGATIPLNEDGRARKIYLARAKKLADPDLVHLKALRDVDELKLSFTNITDASLENLAHLEKLEVLSLHGTRVVGPGLVYLANLTKLRELFLSKTEISDDGIAHIAGLTNLEMLFLDETKITDEALMYLKDMQKLNYLDIAQTAVSDTGVPHLAELKGLRRASFHETRLTEDGIAELRTLLPDLGQIHY